MQVPIRLAISVSRFVAASSSFGGDCGSLAISIPHLTSCRAVRQPALGFVEGARLGE